MGMGGAMRARPGKPKGAKRSSCGRRSSSASRRRRSSASWRTGRCRSWCWSRVKERARIRSCRVGNGTRAFITGIAGQDGSYLAELLLERGYEVGGLVRRPLDEPLENIEHLRGDLELVVGDVRDRELLSA